jgi:hypothetical protein
MADRPKAPLEQKEIAKVEDVVVPPTELVLPVAAHTYTREQCMDMVNKAIIATKKGLSVRFA